MPLHYEALIVGEAKRYPHLNQKANVHHSKPLPLILLLTPLRITLFKHNTIDVDSPTWIQQLKDQS